MVSLCAAVQCTLSQWSLIDNSSHTIKNRPSVKSHRKQSHTPIGNQQQGYPVTNSILIFRINLSLYLLDLFYVMFKILIYDIFIYSCTDKLGSLSYYSNIMPTILQPLHTLMFLTPDATTKVYLFSGSLYPSSSPVLPSVQCTVQYSTVQHSATC